jgi:hypothetical protein
MTVIVSKPAVNLREELASLRNQGGYQEQQFWFENLVTNGTFAADTNWTKGTGWTIAAGVATHVGSTTGALVGPLTSNVSRSYWYSLVVSNWTAGYSTFGFGGVTSGAINSDGTKTGLVTATGSGTTVTLNGVTTFAADIDDISVYEADPSDSAPWYLMQKGWKPKRVYVDGLLVKEGAAEDYTVITDGFNYWVKPTVAPGVSTRTCITGELA